MWVATGAPRKLAAGTKGPQVCRPAGAAPFSPVIKKRLGLEIKDGELAGGQTRAGRQRALSQAVQRQPRTPQSQREPKPRAPQCQRTPEPKPELGRAA